MRWPPPAPGGRYVDLHAHTTFSDGLLSPEALVALAVDRGLTALAVTDHDTLDALPRARSAAGYSIELVPGIEISSGLGERDLHILGYFLDPEHGQLRERLARFVIERRQRAEQIVWRLAELGAPVDLDAVMELAGPGVVGRPHIALALLRADHVRTVDDAFKRYLGVHGAAFIPRPAFTPEEAIALIHAAHGVSVLAHPGATLPEDAIEQLAEGGLRGLEVWHPQHGAPTVRRLRALASRLGLLETGGSDYHGPQRGAELGGLNVSVEVLGLLKQVAGVTG